MALVGHDLVGVSAEPVEQLLHVVRQPAAQGRQAIADLGRDGWFDLAVDKSVAGQRPEGLGQHFLADALDLRG